MSSLRELNLDGLIGPTHLTMSDLIRLDFALHAEHIANQIAHVWQP
jgi:hypothetical protein